MRRSFVPRRNLIMHMRRRELLLELIALLVRSNRLLENLLYDLHLVLFPVFIDNEELALFHGELHGAVDREVRWLRPFPAEPLLDQVCVRRAFDHESLVGSVNGGRGCRGVALIRAIPAVRLGRAGRIAIADHASEVTGPLRIENLTDLPLS